MVRRVLTFLGPVGLLLTCLAVLQGQEQKKPAPTVHQPPKQASPTAQRMSQARKLEGTWSGRTAQNEKISFAVASGRIESLSFEGSFSGAGCSSSIKVDTQSSIPILKNSFSVQVSALQGGGTAYTIEGTFAPNMTAEGKLAFGSMPLPGRCEGVASTVWIAKKQEKGKVEEVVPPEDPDIALLAAVEIGDVARVRALLAKGADPNGKDYGNTPLVLSYKHAEIARVLLAAGADPNKKDEYDNPPLYTAARAGSVEVVQALLEAKADPNDVSRWGTPLIAAAERGRMEVVRILLEKGADPNLKAGPDHTTALARAKAEGHTEIIKLLQEYGAVE